MPRKSSPRENSGSGFQTGQEKAITDLTRCRTSVLGGIQDECDPCGHRQHSYNSCRNRHCPKCQYVKQVEWIDRLKHNFPQTRHFHLVFTMPSNFIGYSTETRNILATSRDEIRKVAIFMAL